MQSFDNLWTFYFQIFLLIDPLQWHVGLADSLQQDTAGVVHHQQPIWKSMLVHIRRRWREWGRRLKQFLMPISKSSLASSVRMTSFNVASSFSTCIVGRPLMVRWTASWLWRKGAPRAEGSLVLGMGDVFDLDTGEIVRREFSDHTGLVVSGEGRVAQWGSGTWGRGRQCTHSPLRIRLSLPGLGLGSMSQEWLVTFRALIIHTKSIFFWIRTGLSVKEVPSCLWHLSLSLAAHQISGS